MTMISPASTLPRHPGYLSGRFYPTWFDGAYTTASAFAGGTNGPLTVYPFELPQPLTVVGLYVRVLTGAASSNVKLGIYAHDPVTVRPASGAPLAALNTSQATTTSTANAGTTLGASVALPAGVYWAAVICDNASGPTCMGLSASTLRTSYLIGRSTLNSAPAAGLTLSSAYSSGIPTLVGNEAWSDTTNAGCPVVFLGT